MDLKTRYFLKNLAPQIILLGVFVLIIVWMFHHASTNLNRLNLDFGFGFLFQPSGFDIGLHLIDYSSQSPVYKALLVGLLNTFLVSIIGIILSTVIGIFIGSLSLSNAKIIRILANSYVQTVRNIPLLAQLVFWYTLLIKIIPDYSNSLNVFNAIYLNNRGIALPIIHLPWLSLLLFFSILILAFSLWKKYSPLKIFAITVLIALLVFTLISHPIEFSIQWPVFSRFNIQNAFVIPIEFMCLLIGLSTYFGAFIAEIVRAGVLSVHPAQYESAYSLGLSKSQAFRLILLPQSLPLMIPPSLNQYLNLLKASSLAVVIGYPDLVSVFTGTVLNQTGQAIEIIGITMAIYLSLNALISLIINRYNRTQLIWMAHSDDKS